ncbi:MAG: carboxypeptidase regulatory-like domain-containing protein [Planctomycetota bacterium]|nr:MAG: carboxypeptidase regulatory-like domain-containing protein [Planctomycetota bacterium]REJ94067.1 MAG: carboxypeptidase regulatory-like domain-containing protein [Planctomycetota bacterium]REK21131.1 MAG: carboxypeptidase regulatory-like domain-containing protein [Planctomycetota bacterium]REK29540.1 MAG: carboxypeptidase regulatory-like domain-containing protein [Planctomycetota bacterium]
MKSACFVSLSGVCLLAALWGVTGGGDSDGPVEVGLLDESSFERLAPAGKEVDAIYGDVVLRNQHLSAVIAAPLPTRNANMTVRDVAGCLIDLTVRTDERDQLSAYYPGRRKYPFRSWSMQVDDSAAVDPSDAAATSGQTAAVTVHAEGGDGRPQVDVTYSLSDDEKFVTVTTRYTNTGDDAIEVDLADDLRADGGKEDMVKSPNETSDLFWLEDRYWQQAYGLQAEDRRIQANSNARSSDLKYVDDDGSSTVALAAGESVAVTRRITAGRNLADVRAAFGASEGVEYTSVTLAVRDAAHEWTPEARIELTGEEGTAGTATTDERGEVTLPLPPGRYSATVSVAGHPVLQDYSITVHSGARQSESIILDGYHPGRVTAKMTDEDGNPIPCKIELTPRDDVPRPDWGPETAEFAVRNLRYAPLGEFEQRLLPGTYDVIISHGPEYDAIFTECEVVAGETTTLEETLVRSVDTTGWVSSDFHSHSSPSGDNTSSQLGRVLNLVCEHVEFAPCTEHNRISTYVPHIERLRVAPFIATCSGMELTGSPLPLNHQNAFPLHHHHHHQDGGAPMTDGDPETQIERLALWDNRSEKLIQQNHPDIGWLFYDRNGDQEPDEGYARGVGLIDVMEIHPIDAALDLQPFETRGGKERNHRIFNWLQLLNQGYRIPGVTNTDAHYNFHGSGWLRIWIASPTDDPAEIETLDIVHASEHGRVLMSNGPFLEVTAREAGRAETVGIGEDLVAESGQVELDVRVQCPNWLDVNHVFLLVNGRLHEAHDYTREAHGEKFADGAVKFEQTLEVELPSDAHLVVVAGHHDRTLEPVYGGDYGAQQPTALTNPIFVDIGGDGFTPNKDTLGHPLPVKGD